MQKLSSITSSLVASGSCNLEWPFITAFNSKSVAGLEDLFAIEPKTVPDLVGCCMGANRDRFERELHRLRGYRFKRLLVVGSEAEILAGQYHSKITPKAVLATLGAFEVRYDLPVVFVPTAQAGARLLERWAFYYARQAVETVNNLWEDLAASDGQRFC